MDTSSEYTFPIFISSTDYNLKDFRAELARFLSDLGYKPFLSSAEGFPDNSPNLEPWESCIPVLDKCFVMVLVIDGRYGTGLRWPNYKEYYEENKISPTHGEYIFAHRNKKRMWVFIRKALMPHYQSYRTVMERCNNNKEDAENLISPTLPEYVTFQTLDFINEVKTTKPIPWINEFDDITSVKREIQKKMLNELAELFLVKNKHLEIVVDSFNKAMDSLSPEKKREVLQKINATKDIIDAVDKLEVYESQINQANINLEEAKTNGDIDKAKYEKQIDDLRKKVSDLETETLNLPNSQFFIKDGQIKLGNPNYVDNGILGSAFDTRGIYNTSGLTSNFGLTSRKCDNCGKPEHSPLNLSISNLVYSSQFNTCPSCNRFLCSDCWPRYSTIGTINSSGMMTLGRTDKCPKCVRDGK